MKREERREKSERWRCVVGKEPKKEPPRSIEISKQRQRAAAKRKCRFSLCERSPLFSSSKRAASDERRASKTVAQDELQKRGSLAVGRNRRC